MPSRACHQPLRTTPSNSSTHLHDACAHELLQLGHDLRLLHVALCGCWVILQGNTTNQHIAAVACKWFDTRIPAHTLWIPREGTCLEVVQYLPAARSDASPSVVGVQGSNNARCVPHDGRCPSKLQLSNWVSGSVLPHDRVRQDVLDLRVRHGLLLLELALLLCHALAAGRLQHRVLVSALPPTCGPTYISVSTTRGVLESRGSE